MRYCSGHGCLLRESCERYSVYGRMLSVYSPSHGCNFYKKKKLQPEIIDYKTLKKRIAK